MRCIIGQIAFIVGVMLCSACTDQGNAVDAGPTDAAPVQDEGPKQSDGGSLDTMEPDGKEWQLVEITNQVPAELTASAFGAYYWNANDGMIQTWALPEECQSATDPNGCVRLFRHRRGTFTALPAPAGLASLTWFSTCVPRQQTATRAFALAVVGGTVRLFSFDATVANPSWDEEASTGEGFVPGDVVNGLSCPTPDELLAVGTSDVAANPRPRMARFKRGEGWSRVTVPPAANAETFLFSVSIDAVSNEGWVVGAQTSATSETWPVLYRYAAGSIVSADSLVSTSGWPQGIFSLDTVYSAAGTPPFAVAMGSSSANVAMVFEQGKWTSEALPTPSQGDAVACASATGIGRDVFAICSQNVSCTTAVLHRSAGKPWKMIAEGHATAAAPACQFHSAYVRDENHLMLMGGVEQGASTNYQAWELNWQ